ncbi:ankyrin repeat and SOCS box protein 15-like isoform X2 [Denticeps clupeoides]|uniref:ankyrin repeat and SOCS box protein 15-like isoform X2 n=1 Tax=Denticeps clupeoides TaxID=299321 RepID=UPI0010A3D959|nr:ankyrin repeat and SOCS box protein 15-like isoform X2 [Denticeps clupeoides]
MDYMDEMDEDQLLDYEIQMSIHESCQKACCTEREENFKVLDAIARGDLFLLQELSDLPEAFTEADEKGWYPLHKAAVQSSAQVLEMVLYASYRLSLEEKTMEGESALTLATQAGLVNNVLTLLEHGASPHKTNDKNESALLLAVRMGLLDVAAALISKGALVNQICLKRWTAIHEAARVGCADILKLLLMHGAQVTETDQHGVTAISTAAEFAQVPALELLIQNGANVNAQAPNGDTVLYDSAGSGNPDCIELLLEHGANPNIASLSSQLPIHRAAYEGHYLRALRLSGQSPIHSAADGGHAQCLELLVQKGFNVNALLAPHISENYGDMRRSALYFAVSNGDVTCTEMLLNAGAKPDLDPLRCLLVAVRAGRYEIVKMLLAKQADVNCYFTVVSDTVFPTALQYCLRDEVMMRLLLNSGYHADCCFRCPQRGMCDDGGSCHQGDKVPFCDFISVSWLVDFAVGTVKILMDYVGQVQICTRLRSILKQHKGWLEICHMLENPRTLKHLCRLVIRHHMTPKRLANPDIMKRLPCPPRLNDFLLYKEYDLYGKVICSSGL